MNYVFRFIKGLFTFRLEISDAPEGPKLKTLNLPGALKHYINLEARFFLLCLIYGHIELV